MLQKYLLAFICGGLFIGGLVYFAAGHRSAPPAAPAATQSDSTAVPPETPAAAPEPAPALEQPARTVRRHESAPPEPEPPASAAPEPPSEQRVEQAQANPQPAQPVEEANPQPQLPPPSPNAQPQLPPPPAAALQTRPSNVMRPDPLAETRDHTPHTVTIPAGTTLAVRLRDSISSEKQSEGDPFTATLDKPIVIDGFVIADRGALVQGKISALKRAGRGESHAAIGLELTALSTTDGQKVNIRTDASRKTAASDTKSAVTKVGVGAVLGTIIGAAVGGGKGAAIGAGAGTAAGGGAALGSKGQEVRLPSETLLSFKLTEAVKLTEKLN